MCGIIGYIGGKQAVPILIDGLKKLEYRGYDSSGVGVIPSDINGGAHAVQPKVVLRKTHGKIQNLQKLIESQPLPKTVSPTGLMRILTPIVRGKFLLFITGS